MNATQKFFWKYCGNIGKKTSAAYHVEQRTELTGGLVDICAQVWKDNKTGEYTYQVFADRDTLRSILGGELKDFWYIVQKGLPGNPSFKDESVCRDEAEKVAIQMNVDIETLYDKTMRSKSKGMILVAIYNKKKTKLRLVQCYEHEMRKQSLASRKTWEIKNLKEAIQYIRHLALENNLEYKETDSKIKQEDLYLD